MTHRFTPPGAIVALLVFALMALIMPPAPANATTVSDCQAQINTLIAQTNATTFTGKNATTDQANLVGKLTAAQGKLNEGKFADAIAKLNDFIAKVNQLAPQGKISQTDANALVTGAESARTCIQQIS
jgi:hypothetical protein